MVTKWNDEDFVLLQSVDKQIDDPWLSDNTKHKRQENLSIIDNQVVDTSKLQPTDPVLDQYESELTSMTEEQLAYKDFQKDSKFGEDDEKQILTDFDDVNYEVDTEFDYTEEKHNFEHYYFDVPELDETDDSDQRNWTETPDTKNITRDFKQQQIAEYKANELSDLIQWRNESERESIVQFLTDFYLKYNHPSTHAELKQVVHFHPTFDILQDFIELRIEWLDVYSGDRFKHLTWKNAYTISKFRMESSIDSIIDESFIENWFDCIETRKYYNNLEEYFASQEPFSGSEFINDSLQLQDKFDYSIKCKEYLDVYEWLLEHEQ